MSICIHGNLCREIYKKTGYIHSRTCPKNCKYFEPKTGHWIEENINEYSRKVFCSECGCPPPFEHVNNGDVYSASGYGVFNNTKFCPNCGAKMIESQESEEKNKNCNTCRHHKPDNPYCECCFNLDKFEQQD